MTIKDSKYVKINSVYPLYFNVNKVNRYFEEINENKYLTLVSTSGSKEQVKKYEEQWSKIRDLIKLIAKHSDDHDEKYMEIKFNSDDKLPLKTIEVNSTIIVVRTFFHENNEYYSQVL